MFGKVMSISDELMWRYFPLVLGTPAEELQALRGQHPRQAKDELARRIVARFHGEAAGWRASEEFARIFAKSELPSDIAEFIISEPELSLPALLVRCHLAASNGEARRLVEQGAVRIDDQKVTDLKASITPRPGMVIKAGKRGFARLVG